MTATIVTWYLVLSSISGIGAAMTTVPMLDGQSCRHYEKYFNSQTREYYTHAWCVKGGVQR